jgi:steroid delta-isomerase-like uncharacterized protein
VSERNKTLFRDAIEEVWNKRNLDVADRYFATDVIVHHPLDRNLHGLDGLKQFPIAFHAAFSDLNVTIEHVLADRDRIGARWIIHGTHDGTFMNVPPTGRAVTIPVNEVLRVEDGKLKELWLEINTLAVAQQLGIIPAIEKVPKPFLKLVSMIQRWKAKRSGTGGAAA